MTSPPIMQMAYRHLEQAHERFYRQVAKAFPVGAPLLLWRSYQQKSGTPCHVVGHDKDQVQVVLDTTNKVLWFGWDKFELPPQKKRLRR